MPAPLMVTKIPALAVIVNALAPELNVIPATVVLAEMETPVVFETAKVATSVELLGYPVAGVQFVFVFQSPLTGVTSQVALPANAEPHAANTNRSALAVKIRRRL
jgi:hypothetical protein